MSDVDFAEFYELAALAKAAIDEFVDDVRVAVAHAADEGVREAQTNHPYTDRTYRLTGTARATLAGGPRLEPEAEMMWPAPYAGFVDEGTTRSRPYPFTPQATGRAEAALDRAVELAADKLERKIGG